MTHLQELTVAVSRQRTSLRKTVIALLLLAAFVHVPVAVQHVHESPPLAVAFVVLILAAAACAAALAAADRPVFWAAAAVLSCAAGAAYLGSRAIGFPGRPDDIGDWGNPLGCVALAAEAGILAVSCIALRPGPAAHDGHPGGSAAPRRPAAKSEHLHPVTARRELIGKPFSAILLMPGAAAGGRLSLIEHRLGPRSLGSPVHTHQHEDEYSVVLKGRVGAQVGDELLHGGPGDVIAKPRGIPHAFWNAGDEPARILEIITPGGFEDYFAALGELLAGGAPPDPAQQQETMEHFGLDMDRDSVPRLAAEHRLRLP